MAYQKNGDAHTSNLNAPRYFDGADWHTRARVGTTSALTQGGYTPGEGDNGHLSTLQAAPALVAAKLASPVGVLASGSGKAKFSREEGTLTVAVTPGVYVYMYVCVY
jgi:hypothetical protein